MKLMVSIDLAPLPLGDYAGLHAAVLLLPLALAHPLSLKTPLPCFALGGFGRYYFAFAGVAGVEDVVPQEFLAICGRSFNNGAA
jgi:hypothetical protein